VREQLDHIRAELEKLAREVERFTGPFAPGGAGGGDGGGDGGDDAQTRRALMQFGSRPCGGEGLNVEQKVAEKVDGLANQGTPSSGIWLEQDRTHS
jgi:hypothetical protein